MNTLKSILKVLFWLFLVLFIILVLGNGYTMWQMERAKTQIYASARQLGYTPTARLRDTIVYADVNIVTAAVRCVLTLYYTTPLSVNEFEEQLTKLNLQVERYDGVMSDMIVSEIPLTVDGMDGRKLFWSNPDHEKLKWINSYTWSTSNDRPRPGVQFYVLNQLDHRFEYNGRSLIGNIIGVRVNVGEFSAWRRAGVLLWETLNRYRF